MMLWNWRLAVIPVGLFIVICFTAPFCHRLGFFFPVVSRGASGKKAVAITVDDGPDPLSTLPLLHLFDAYGIPATFFVTGEKVAAHPWLVKEILHSGHGVGNHSYSHDPLFSFRTPATLDREIECTQSVLEGLGIRPLVFRPPAGILGPRVGDSAMRAGLTVVTFSRRGMDFGNRRIKGLGRKILGRIRPGDIVLLHDGLPEGGRHLSSWLSEIEGLLTGLRKKGMVVLPLAELIGRRTMTMVEPPSDDLSSDSTGGVDLSRRDRQCPTFKDCPHGGIKI
jgi:peptidoglycan/xylan/chitin deacetylase (PgdA/CDA1 family)